MLDTKNYIGKKIQLSEGYIKHFAENPCSFPRIWEVESQKEDGFLRAVNRNEEHLTLNINNNKEEDGRYFWVVEEKWQNIPLREKAAQALERLKLKPGDAVLCVDVPRSADIDPDLQCKVWEFVGSYGVVLSVDVACGEVRVEFPRLKKSMSLMAYTLRNLEKLPEYIDYTGKKVRLTEKGIKRLGCLSRTTSEIGEVIEEHSYGGYGLRFKDPERNYTLWDHTSNDPEFEIIKEEPAAQQATPDVNYIGTKMYLTERGRELYGYSDVPLTSEWEVAEIEEKSIVTLHNKEYGYETKATYVSLFMFAEQRDFTFEKPEQPSVKQKSTADYIGKKVRATKAGEEYRRAQGLENFDDWEILGPDREGELKIKSPQSEYTIYTTWDALFGETPHFEIIEEPEVMGCTGNLEELYIQPVSETHFEKLPPPVFAGNTKYTTMPLPEEECWQNNHRATQSSIPSGHTSASQNPTVLDKAKDLIFGDRVKDYGKTSDNFANICTGWEIIFKDGFTPERVGLAMAWLKICRASNDNCDKEDSLVDLAGYAGCIEKIKKNL